MADDQQTTLPSQKKRPLVTFALFAYNQEKYIREAVEAAFAQTYEPLEIILSDDCSTDRTFEIMAEMVASYTGPHKIILNRNTINFGTSLHVQFVAEKCSGCLLIVAAGDDISLAERTQNIVEAWLKNDMQAYLLHSSAYAFNENTHSPRKLLPIIETRKEKLNINWFNKRKKNPILAPTAAYSIKLFKEFPPLIGGSFIEDGPLVFRALLRGEILGISKPLVLQRKLNQTAGTGYSHNDVERWNNLIRSKIISALNKLQDLNTSQIHIREKRSAKRVLSKDIRNLSNCILTEYKRTTYTSKILVFFQLLIYYPNNEGLISRIKFSLKFIGLKRKR